MKILLIQPPVQDFYQTACRTYPIGLCYLAAVLVENGFEVSILDAHNPALRKTIPLPSRFQYIRRYYAPDNRSPYRLFNHYYHFGLELPDIEERIRRTKPDLVGISSLFTPYSDQALEIARVVKRINTRIITVMGGTHAWSMPEHLLDSGTVDYLIRGEGEWSLLRLCRELAREIPDREAIAEIEGIGFKRSRSVFLHPEYAVADDLDSLPFPARDLVDPRDYTMGGRNYTVLLTSRGCPHNCGFCALPGTPCSRFRHRSPDRVLEEIGHCYKRYGIRHFDIEDDNFTVNQKHADKILDGIREMGLEEIRLSAMNGISASSLTPDLAAKMKDAGFTHMDLALVTSNKAQREELTRPGNVDQFCDALSYVNARNFRTTVHLILGLPEDSVENMMESLLFLMEKPCLIGANIYYPVPGSSLFKQYREHICFPDPLFWRSTLASCESFEGHREATMALFYLARIINFMKHLLARYPRQESERTAEALISGWVSQLGLPEDPESLHVEGVTRKTPWDPDRLGLFMLRRFAERGEIEKVQIRRRNGKTLYTFSSDFGDRQLIKTFWARARSTALETTR
jgi:radical SAM superfamily enzyme YgiQ (UPF0313 family)